MSDLPPSSSGPSPVPPQTPGSSPPLNYGVFDPGGFNWNDFLAFRTMFAIPVIKVLFWVGVIFWIIGGLITMVTGGSTGSHLAGLCVGLAMIIIGPFLVRIYCEFLIVVF